jgi:hypothetical protein
MTRGFVYSALLVSWHSFCPWWKYCDQPKRTSSPIRHVGSILLALLYDLVVALHVGCWLHVNQLMKHRRAVCLNERHNHSFNYVMRFPHSYGVRYTIFIFWPPDTILNIHFRHELIVETQLIEQRLATISWHGVRYGLHCRYYLHDYHCRRVFIRIPWAVPLKASRKGLRPIL